MWHQYRVELYPHTRGCRLEFPISLDIRRSFPAAFRKTRTFHQPKGIVKIIH